MSCRCCGRTGLNYNDGLYAVTLWLYRHQAGEAICYLCRDWLLNVLAGKRSRTVPVPVRFR